MSICKNQDSLTAPTLESGRTFLDFSRLKAGYSRKRVERHSTRWNRLLVCQYESGGLSIFTTPRTCAAGRGRLFRHIQNRGKFILKRFTKLSARYSRCQEGLVAFCAEITFLRQIRRYAIPTLRAAPCKIKTRRKLEKYPALN